MKEMGAPTEGKKKTKNFLQPGQASKLQDLKAQARRAGWRYWLRVGIGFLIMILFVFMVCNVYLFHSFRSELENPCSVCRDLNPMATSCLPVEQGQIYFGEEESWISWNPWGSFARKVFKLSLPCDACAELNPDQADCLDRLFNQNNKKENIDFEEFNLTLEPLP